MSGLKRCKVCGMIMFGPRFPDKCPACGAAASAFEEYTGTIDEKRLKKMRLHIHPISVHYPEAIIPMMLICHILMGIEALNRGEFFMITSAGLALFLPFGVLLAIISGLIAARLRFKKAKSPYVKLKIIIGACLLALSVVILIVHSGEQSIMYTPIPIILDIIALGLALLLGLLGGQLMGAIIPDKRQAT